MTHVRLVRPFYKSFQKLPLAEPSVKSKLSVVQGTCVVTSVTCHLVSRLTSAIDDTDFLEMSIGNGIFALHAQIFSGSWLSLSIL